MSPEKSSLVSLEKGFMVNREIRVPMLFNMVERSKELVVVVVTGGSVVVELELELELVVVEIRWSSVVRWSRISR